MARKRLYGTTASEWIDVTAQLAGHTDGANLTADAGNDGVFGSLYADSILGGLGNDSLWGNGGHDTLAGEDGDDLLYGGEGNDSLRGGIGNDNAWGGIGNDKLVLEAGHDLGYGEDGNDGLDGGEGNDSLWGGLGDDTLSGGLGNDDLYGEAGDDSIVAGEGANRVSAGEGNDTITAGAGDDTIAGDGGRDRITAGEGHNIVWGGADDDTIAAGGGNDSIAGDDGADSINGGNGQNTIHGGLGNDTIATGSSNDSITGDDGADTISSGSGNDTVYGGTGNDTVLGGAGDDLMTGDSGSDVLDGGAGADTIYAGDGDDLVIHARSGSYGHADLADGGSGQDTLRLALSRAEWFSAAVQNEVARYAAFLAKPEASWSSFTFDFGLTARGFEAAHAMVDGLELSLADDAVTAVDDAFTLSENEPFMGSVLANDVVPDLVAKVELVSGPVEGKLTLNADGTFSYNPLAHFQRLAVGETEQVAFTYRVTDADGDTGEAVVTLTVTGANDAPTVTLSAIQTGGVVEKADGVSGENSGNLTAKGSFAFADVDLTDTHSVSVVLASAVDSATGLPTSGSGTLVPTIGNVATGDGKGTVSWTYTVLAGALDDLAAGQTITQIYQVTVTDSSGAAVTKDVTITLTGTNDAPVVSGAVTGAAAEDGAAVTLSALAKASDVDAGTTLSVISPDTLPAGVTYDAATQSFTLDPSHAAYQGLAAGQTTVVTVNYGVFDGTATTPASMSWTLTGTNDAAEISGVDTGTVKEDTILAASGKLDITDRDTGEARFQANGSIAGSYGTLSIDEQGNWTYTLANGTLAVQTLKAGGVVQDQILVRALDGTEHVLTLDIQGTDERRVGPDRSGIDVVILAADYDGFPVNQLLEQGFSSVKVYNVANQSASADWLVGAEAVLAYTNSLPPSGLGNLLADFVDAGGGVVLGTYSMSFPWAITGRITEAGYSPFLPTNNLGTPSGDLVATVPDDPVFDGLDLSTFTYWSNDNYAYAGLADGAELLATDGAGVNMVARNADGNVIAINIFPGQYEFITHGPEVWTLYGNALADVAAVNDMVTEEVEALGIANGDHFHTGQGTIEVGPWYSEQVRGIVEFEVSGSSYRSATLTFNEGSAPGSVIYPLSGVFNGTVNVHWYAADGDVVLADYLQSADSENLLMTISTSSFGTGQKFTIDVSDELEEIIKSGADVGFLFTYQAVGGSSAPIHFNNFDLAFA